jgi:dethiobiotin synthetase
MRGLFVSGTDTGVGKTILTASLLAAMAAAGERVRALKPVLTGLADRPAASPSTAPAERSARPVGRPGQWPPDHELLASVADMAPEEVAPLRYGPAVSPHLAAARTGAPIEPARLIARARALASAGTPLVVEGVGGLLVPLSDDFTVRDFALALGLPILIAARPGLGTINHTLLTLQAARAAGLDVRAVVLTPWPEAPSLMERSNRETIAAFGEVEVETLARVPEPRPSALAQAGQALPWRRWLGGPQGAEGHGQTQAVALR